MKDRGKFWSLLFFFEVIIHIEPSEDLGRRPPLLQWKLSETKGFVVCFLCNRHKP